MGISKGERHFFGSTDTLTGLHSHFVPLRTHNKIEVGAKWAKEHYKEIISVAAVAVTAGSVAYELSNGGKQPVTIPLNRAGITEPGQNPLNRAQEEFRMHSIDYVKMQDQILKTDGLVFDKFSFVEGMKRMGKTVSGHSIGQAPETGIIGKQGSYLRIYPSTESFFPANETIKAGESVSVISQLSVKDTTDGSEKVYGLIAPKKLETKEVDDRTHAPNVFAFGDKLIQVTPGRYILLSEKKANGIVEKYVDFPSKPNTTGFNRAPQKDSLYKQRPQGYNI
ncbi:hypothetical protein C4559_04900 [Candidatus Microgenomates bacterium]|nr:MAG: hypothetical protein C4559_04900 [Candidatus Microgenomates bacterium]